MATKITRTTGVDLQKVIEEILSKIQGRIMLLDILIGIAKKDITYELIELQDAINYLLLDKKISIGAIKIDENSTIIGLNNGEKLLNGVKIINFTINTINKN